MAIEISGVDDINLMRQYVDLRDTPRMLMVQRIYGNAKRVLAEYQKLVDFLSEHPDYISLHDTTTGQVQPYIQNMIDGLTAVITTMDEVEANNPGTFPGVGD